MSIMKHLTYLSGCMLLIPALASAQALNPMKQDEVTSTFSDKTITTISAATLNDELISDNFTGFFSKDGTMQGKFVQKPKNEPEEDTGTWKVNKDGAFCFKWNQWDGGKEKCVAIYKLSNGFLVVNSEKGFESFILKKDIKSGNQLKKGQ